jgi:hypothetical protein
MKRERVHNHREGKICGVNGGVNGEGGVWRDGVGEEG